MRANVAAIRAIPYLQRATIVFCAESGPLITHLYNVMREIEGGRCHLYKGKKDDPDALGVWTDDRLKMAYLTAASHYINHRNIQYNKDLVTANPALAEREHFNTNQLIAYKKTEFEQQLRNAHYVDRPITSAFSRGGQTWTAKTGDQRAGNSDDIALAFSMAAYLMTLILDGKATWRPS